MRTESRGRIQVLCFQALMSLQVLKSQIWPSLATIPSPRWSTYDAVLLGSKPMKPATIKERAVSSPVWLFRSERSHRLLVTNLLLRIDHEFQKRLRFFQIYFEVAALSLIQNGNVKKIHRQFRRYFNTHLFLGSHG